MTYNQLIYKCLDFIKKTGLRVMFVDDDEDEFCIESNKKMATMAITYMVTSKLLENHDLSEISKRDLKKVNESLFMQLSLVLPNISASLRNFEQQYDAIKSDPFVEELLMQLENVEIPDEERKYIHTYIQSQLDEIPLVSEYEVYRYPIQAILPFAVTAIPYLYFSFSGYSYIDQKYHIYDDSLRKDLFHFMDCSITSLLDHNYYAKYEKSTREESIDDFYSYDSHSDGFEGRDFYIIISLLFTVLDLVLKKEYDKLRRIIDLDHSIIEIQRKLFNPDHDDDGQLFHFFTKTMRSFNYYDIIPDEIRNSDLIFFLSANDLSNDDLALIIRSYGGYKHVIERAVDNDWGILTSILRKYYGQIIVDYLNGISNTLEKRPKSRILIPSNNDRLAQKKALIIGVRDSTSCN